MESKPVQASCNTSKSNNEVLVNASTSKDSTQATDGRKKKQRKEDCGCARELIELTRQNLEENKKKNFILAEISESLKVMANRHLDDNPNLLNNF